jgi:hypothetical protein
MSDSHKETAKADAKTVAENKEKRVYVKETYITFEPVAGGIKVHSVGRKEAALESAYANKALRVARLTPGEIAKLS